MAPRGQFWKIIYQLKHPDGGTFKVKVEAPETKDYRCSNPEYMSPVRIFQEDNPNYVHTETRAMVRRQKEHGVSMFFYVFGFAQSGSKPLPHVVEIPF